MTVQVVILYLHLDDRRAEDVACIVEGDLHALGNLDRCAVGMRAALAERLLGIGDGV